MASLKLVDALLKFIDNAQRSDRVTASTYNALRKDIEALVNEKSCGAILVRLAW